MLKQNCNLSLGDLHPNPPSEFPFCSLSLTWGCETLALWNYDLIRHIITDPAWPCTQTNQKEWWGEQYFYSELDSWYKANSRFRFIQTEIVLDGDSCSFSKDERIKKRFLLHPDSNVFISFHYLYESMAISFCNEHDIGGKSEQKRKVLIYLVPEGRRVRHQMETLY